jgi:hypothetical protein
LSKKGAKLIFIDFIEILNKWRGVNRVNFPMTKAKCPIRFIGSVGFIEFVEFIGLTQGTQVTFKKLLGLMDQLK